MQLYNSSQIMTLIYKSIVRVVTRKCHKSKSKVRGKKMRALLFLRQIRLRRSLARSLAIRNGDDAKP